MKRALAERAKQSGLPNGVGPSVPSSEPTTSSILSNPPPSSLPELSTSFSAPNNESAEPDNSNSTPAVNSSDKDTPKTPLSIAAKTNASTASPRPSPRPKKRLRESLVKQLEEEDEDDSSANAFFLRHQNRALASELRQLKYQLTRLERERDTRRSQCSLAVHNLNTLQTTWTQLEEALQHGQPPPPASNHNDAPNDDSNTEMTAAPQGRSGASSAPLSTGSGTSVELVGALFQSIAELGTTGATSATASRRVKSETGDSMDVDDGHDDDSSSDEEHLQQQLSSEPLPPIQGEEDVQDDPANAQHLEELMRITENVAQRASTLQGWIWSLLQRLEKGGDSEDSSTATNTVRVAQQIHAAQQQVARLKAKNKALKAQMKELARSRDESTDSEKRVRRGLYRLAAGRVQLKEVLKAIVASDEDKELAAEWMGTSTVLSTPLVTAAAATAASTSVKKEETSGDDGKESSVSSAEVAQLQKTVLDLEQVASARDEQIKMLLAEREEQTKKISGLVLAGTGKATDAPTDEEMKQSDLYAELSSKLSAAERLVKEAKEKEQKIKEEWGQALATAEEAQKAIEDLNAKHVKRWQDLAEEFPDATANGDEEMAEGGTENNNGIDSKAKEIVILQHKLTQALENVRQAQSTRKTLQEAVIINESLQSKLEEIKTKYASLQQSRANGTPVAMDEATTPKGKATPTDVESSEKPEKIERPDKSDKAADKLHREYRRIQKQLVAATASKESAKAKLERAEKERDTLVSTNSRLLKQAAEKDEMNAKSLSTILHLKQLTDQITKEKENLEQQVKSSQQLALSARLAANARERLSEELDKERQGIEARVKDWEEKCQTLAQEKEQIEAKLMQNRSRMAGLFKDVESAKKRCEELASESTKLQEEKHKLMESLAIAKKEAEEATNLTERISQASGGAIVEGFTAEQLHTQVKHLKTRLNCPVCNARDKKCILLRCRHMFCKNCVDETIKNRSRKCPACGIRFDTKDVADIWL